MPEPVRALLVVDVQRDFCEGGSLAVNGGADLAPSITGFVRAHRPDYVEVVASRDWHRAHPRLVRRLLHRPEDNRGHFAVPPMRPDFVGTWPAHCLAGTPGADYEPGFDASLATVEVRKGYGFPAYSMFEGSDTGETGAGVRGFPTLAALLHARRVEAVDVVGIAADYCCLATAKSALTEGLSVRVLRDLQVGVDPAATEAAFDALAAEGAEIVESRTLPHGRS